MINVMNHLGAVAVAHGIVSVLTFLGGAAIAVGWGVVHRDR